MIAYHRYGRVQTFPIKFTLNNVGVNVTLAAGDVKISTDGNAPANVANLPTAIHAADMPGVFLWTPSVAEMQCEIFVVNIKDAAGSAFDENMIYCRTGGDGSAAYDGT